MTEKYSKNKGRTAGNPYKYYAKRGNIPPTKISAPLLWLALAILPHPCRFGQPLAPAPLWFQCLFCPHHRTHLQARWAKNKRERQDSG